MEQKIRKFKTTNNIQVFVFIISSKSPMELNIDKQNIKNIKKMFSNL